ncbi:UDP-glucosyltransferase 2-like [Schistocerca nitens]|uniref:UDP-glucosyltransferase 2-like n=1 Tax=Schistocerca nitens TaxID=7011 RepID=UPI002117A6C4|nr:UDP-glucosyltransferase 2-like [Schistocerca nitens]
MPDPLESDDQGYLTSPTNWGPGVQWPPERNCRDSRNRSEALPRTDGHAGCAGRFSELHGEALAFCRLTRGFLGSRSETLAGNMGMARVWLLLVLTAHCSRSADILFVAPTWAVSHALPLHKVVTALLGRGHHVTYVTPHPLQPEKNENYTLVDLTLPVMKPAIVNRSILADTWPMRLVEAYHESGVLCCNRLKHPAMQEWLKSDHRFDLVVMERLPYQCFYGLVHKVGLPPMVGILTLPAMAPTYYAIGNPINPAYLSDVFIGYTDHMNFWQRLYNTYFIARFLYFWQTTVLPAHEAIMREIFGPDPPSVYEMERNFSMLIVDVHFSGDYPRPNVPNVIEVTGLHVEDNVEPLPQDIQKFLDEAEHGVIYFNLGSNVKSSTLPEHRRQAFVDAFREMPQRVVWKWEDDNIPDLPDNVLVRKWLPQQGILAHPKVKLFIMQGGIQSLNEAAFRSIPLIAVPFFSDQRHNCAKINAAGIGVRIYLKDITKESVLDAIHRVLEDPSYKERMAQYSRLFREHREQSVETAVWWLEYVIRHKGAPHLRSAALDLHWWQLLLLDVIAFVLAAAAAAVTALWFVARRLLVAFTARKDKLKTH